MERLRSSTMAVGQFDISYWSFSKSAIKQALSVLDAPMEEQAIKMFSSILIYSGLEEPGMLSYLSIGCECKLLCNK